MIIDHQSPLSISRQGEKEMISIERIERNQLIGAQKKPALGLELAIKMKEV